MNDADVQKQVCLDFDHNWRGAFSIQVNNAIDVHE